jgi:hypothetical protein
MYGRLRQAMIIERMVVLIRIIHAMLVLWAYVAKAARQIPNTVWLLRFEVCQKQEKEAKSPDLNLEG